MSKSATNEQDGPEPKVHKGRLTENNRNPNQSQAIGVIDVNAGNVDCGWDSNASGINDHVTSNHWQ